MVVRLRHRQRLLDLPGRGAAIRLEACFPNRAILFGARHVKTGLFMLATAAAFSIFQPNFARADDNGPPPGFTALFNGKDLTGWKGLLKEPFDNPARRAKLTAEQPAEAQKEADEVMRKGWRVENGMLMFDGQRPQPLHRQRLRRFRTVRRLEDRAPRRQRHLSPRLAAGANLGSLHQAHDVRQRSRLRRPLQQPKAPSNPRKVADHPIGQWNTFYIKMVGDKVTVKLNGKLVVDNVVLENYWERDKPIYPTGQIELQNHGSTLWFKNIYLRELPRGKIPPKDG